MGRASERPSVPARRFMDPARRRSGMRIPKAVAALVMGMLLSASALHAQGAEFSLGGGIDLPLGDFDDAAKLGFHGLAGVSVVPTNWPVGIQVDGNYSQFSDDTPADLKFQLIYGT